MYVNVLQAIILGVVQGVTEFIPVSSSGHLVLAHRVLGTNENGLAFDAALNVGTLVALLIFFYKDIGQLFMSLLKRSDQTRLALLIIMATLPAVVFGVLLQKAAESSFRSPLLVSINLIIVAFLMLWAERLYAKRKQHTSVEEITTKQAALIGLSQAAAIVPGVSRSGGTITVGLFAGLDRTAATRFSFLLAIPITAGAILKVLVSHQSVKLIRAEEGLFFIGFVAAFVSGLFAIRFMLKFVAGHSLRAFAYYRIAIGSLFIVLLMAGLFR